MTHRAAAAARPADTLAAALVERVRQAARAALEEGAAAAAAAAAREQAEARLAGAVGEPLRRLARLFRLGDAELDLLQVCVAHALDLGLGAVFARLNDNPGHYFPTPAVVARSFGHSPGRVWNPGGALAVWGLVAAQPGVPGEPLSLSVDPVVPAWLEGAMWVDRCLAGCVRTLDPVLRLEAWPLQALAAAVRHALAHGRALRVLLRGEPGAGRRECAAAAAAVAGLSALEVDTDAIADEHWAELYVRLQRLAAISGTALVWCGSRLQRPWPRLVAPAPVHFVVCDDTVPPPLPALAQIEAEVPSPDTATRRCLWSVLVPGAEGWPAEALDGLARHYRLGAGDLLRLAQDAPATPEAAAALARRWGRGEASDAVQVLDCPHAWEDLVLPPALGAALADFAYEAAERERVWEQGAAGRLLTHESGVVALFAGPSGTGKTMAAQVVAARLQLELLRVDLAAVVSKYIGETAKNLRQVFALARRRQAVLLFDEADACFTRRTEVKDAHDRYANADTNYLLQLLEAHRGTVILASNRRGDIDPAFVRRLRHVLAFEHPEPAQRLALWQRALQALGADGDEGCAALAAALAEAVELSGAQVRNAALTAVFAARRADVRVGVAQLLHGAERELAKDGRGLPPRFKERWVRHA